MENEIKTNQNDSHMYEHIYLRGNFQLDMFYDNVDMINVWNRIWLSAKATGIQILSVIILNNHFHLTVKIKNNEQRSNFMHHLRLSITQYHNKRYKVHGTLGTRRFKHATLNDLDDMKDCICYHIRNILHHGISSDFLDYPFSTARFVFNLTTNKQKGIYTRKTILPKWEAYLPTRQYLPDGWTMTIEGIIVPPHEIFRTDIIEDLFSNSPDEYLQTLSHQTKREKTDIDDPESEIRIHASHSRKIQDEQVVEFIKENCSILIPSMNENQKTEAIRTVITAFPKVSQKMLSRLFGIPYTTLLYRLGKWKR